MVRAGDRSCFALEPLAEFGSIGKMGRQNLDGNDAVEAGIAGLVNLAHPARTNGGKNFIGP